MCKIIGSKKAVGKIVCCSLGHVLLGLEDDNGSLKSMVIKASKRYPIGLSYSQVSTFSSPYMKLSKKDLKRISINEIDTEKLRKKFERVQKEENKDAQKRFKIIN